MADTPLCPTCHSKISPTGSRIKDADSPGVPAWSDDPCLTKDGFNGDNYKGIQYLQAKWIKELQDTRVQQESDAGITPPTEFTPIGTDVIYLTATHFTELRISTERLLDAIGTTLSDYFSLDADGNTQPPGPHDVQIISGPSGPQYKSEWSYVSRGTAYNNQNKNLSILKSPTDSTQFYVDATKLIDTPTVTKDTTFISAILFEDLRHPIQLGAWLQYYWDSFIVPASLSNYNIPQTDPTTIPPQLGSNKINKWTYLSGSAPYTSSGVTGDGQINYSLNQTGVEVGSAVSLDMNSTITAAIQGGTYTEYVEGGHQVQNFLNLSLLLEGLYDNLIFVDSAYYFKITPSSKIRLTYSTNFSASETVIDCQQLSNEVYPPNPDRIPNPPVHSTVTMRTDCTFQILVGFVPKDGAYLFDGPFKVVLTYTTMVGGTSNIPASATDLDIPIYSTLLAIFPNIVNYYNGTKGNKGLRLDSVEIIMNNSSRKSGVFPAGAGTIYTQPYNPNDPFKEIVGVTIPSFGYSQPAEAILNKIRVKQ
jgi:hypothetical protein